MALQPKPADQAAGLFPGVSFYQVLEPSKILGPGGVLQFAMVGPFPTLLAADAYANTRPGSLITVTLVLHQAPAVAAVELVKK